MNNDHENPVETSQTTKPGRAIKIHYTPAADGSLPPDEWITLPDDCEDPLMAAFNLCSHARPTYLWVQEGTMEHPNGAPMCATRYMLDWRK